VVCGMAAIRRELVGSRRNVVALRLRPPYHIRYEPRRKAILQTRPYVRRIGQCGGSHSILHVPTALWAAKRQRGMASRRLTPFWSTGLLPRDADYLDRNGTCRGTLHLAPTPFARSTSPCLDRVVGHFRLAVR